MPISEKTERKLNCDREGCKVEIIWNPILEPGQQPPKLLHSAVFVQHALTGFATVYCSPACAILNLDEGKYLPPLPATPSTIQLAGEGEMKHVAAQADATKQLKVN